MGEVLVHRRDVHQFLDDLPQRVGLASLVAEPAAVVKLLDDHVRTGDPANRVGKLTGGHRIVGVVVPRGLGDAGQGAAAVVARQP
ncbi:hypothetical protein AB0D14_01715 [Streptomyces sp. NPDC048484]|uniref:hypothetical protein n=1 Tax=Streptomyces sp. NPDC048484 TaxID=3155146 RepID=UPI00342498EB